MQRSEALLYHGRYTEMPPGRQGGVAWLEGQPNGRSALYPPIISIPTGPFIRLRASEIQQS
jgi:hypothetical protein